jgi:hypothetical protein
MERASGRQRKHGQRGRWAGRKLPWAVNPNSGEILASELTSNEVGDRSLVRPLLDQTASPNSSLTGFIHQRPANGLSPETRDSCSPANQQEWYGTSTANGLALVGHPASRIRNEVVLVVVPVVDQHAEATHVTNDARRHRFLKAGTRGQPHY